MKRFEATFLLKAIFCVVAIALFLLLIWVATTFQAMTIPVLIFIAVFWFLGLEMQLLPWLMEHWAVGRASRSGGKASSIWFVDLEADKRTGLFRDVVLIENTKNVDVVAKVERSVLVQP